jgi:hypothetical protein
MLGAPPTKLLDSDRGRVAHPEIVFRNRPDDRLVVGESVLSVARRICVASFRETASFSCADSSKSVSFISARKTKLQSLFVPVVSRY